MNNKILSQFLMAIIKISQKQKYLSLYTNYQSEYKIRTMGGHGPLTPPPHGYATVGTQQFSFTHVISKRSTRRVRRGSLFFS